MLSFSERIGSIVFKIIALLVGMLMFNVFPVLLLMGGLRVLFLRIIVLVLLLLLLLTMPTDPRRPILPPLSASPVQKDGEFPVSLR